MRGQSAGKKFSIYMTDTDLAWLGGIWDGEGSIALFTHIERNGSTKICPTVCVVNTDIAIINKVRKLLEGIGCNFQLQEYKPKNVRHNVRWDLTTRNQKHIITFIKAVMPYLFSIKRQKAEILLDYCERRSEKTKRLPSKGSTPYDDDDWSTFNKFQEIRSSQTTREAVVQD